MANDNKEVLLDVKHLEITFYQNKKRFRAVKDANFQIYKGETFALVGESGSGKTTIGRSIIRLNATSDGEIIYKGKKINGKISKEEEREVVRNIQMIFQDPAASLNERATIDYCISEGLYNFKLFENEEEREAKVDNALKSVGLLPEHKSRYAHEFSGGQRQRAWIAMTLAQETEIIMLDEPTTYLDMSYQLEVLEVLEKLNKEKNITVVIVLHELNNACIFADNIIGFKKGKVICEGKPLDVITKENLKKIYGIEANLTISEDGKYPICMEYDLFREA